MRGQRALQGIDLGFVRGWEMGCRGMSHGASSI